jgi:antitoxin HicB
MKRGSMKRKKSGRQAVVAYLCRIRPEPEGGFTVTCPKLPPVVTYGETLEEALANAREAIELYLEVMREDGQQAITCTVSSMTRKNSAYGNRRHRARRRSL